MCSKLKQKRQVESHPGEVQPLQMVVGVLALALGSSSPLLDVCTLCTPGFRYAFLDVGV